MNDRFIPQHLAGESLLIVGVSGGADSLCLLDCLHKSGYRLIVAHFDHQLRPGSDQEGARVRSLAERMGLPFVGGGGDVRRFAAENGHSLEEAARIARYRFLFHLAREEQAQAVAVGHTADDQVETILMHFLRGSGLSGLKGMTGRTLLPEFDPHLPLLRPILHLWRQETEAYCRDHGLEPLIDPSNQDETFFRNRLRNSLVPELEKYNPGIKQTLLRMAEALAGDHEILATALDAAWQAVVLEESPTHLRLQASTLAGFPAGLRRNIFRKAFGLLSPGLRSLDFETLERASNFSALPAGPDGQAGLPPRMDLPGNLMLLREGDDIYLSARQAPLPTSDLPLISAPLEMQTGAEVALNPQFTLSIQAVDPGQHLAEAQENTDPFTAWLDADQCGDHFTIRTRQAGDSFSPLGMNRQTVKLREFYINARIPARVRGGWPLVCARDQIAWVPGHRIAHPFRVTPATRRVLRLCIRRRQTPGAPPGSQAKD